MKSQSISFHGGTSLSTTISYRDSFSKMNVEKILGADQLCPSDLLTLGWQREGLSRPSRILPSIIILAAAITVLLQVKIVHAEVEPKRLDWLRIVPGDVHFYVELSELSKIRDRFLKLGIWRTIRELTEQDATGPTTQPWHERSEEFLGLGPEAAVSRIIGRHCALIASDFRSVASGVILAELDETVGVRDLLKEWAAQRLSTKGDVRLYRLRGGILLAVWNRQLIFGAADDPDGLWVRTVALLANLIDGRQGSHLRGRPEFASLATRLEGESSCLLYAAWPDESDKSAGGAPSFQRLIASVSFHSEGIQCRIRAQRKGGHESLARLDVASLRQLPQDSIVVWSGAFSMDRMGAGLQETISDGERSLEGMLSAMLRMLAAPGSASDMKLGPRATLVVGKEPHTTNKAVILPTITLIIETKQAQVHAQMIESVVDVLMRALSITGQNSPASQPATVQKKEVLDAQIRYVDLGNLLVDRTGLPPLQSLEFCWTGDGNRLMFSSSMRHLQAVLTAVHEKSSGNVLGTLKPHILPQVKKDLPIVEWTFIRGHEIATIFRSWLIFIQRKHTEALSDIWWQSWAQQRVQSGVKLGVGLADDPTRPSCAVVHEIDSQSPTNGILQRDDVIIAVAGRPLKRPNPAQDVAARYRARGNATVFRLQVLRAGKSMILDIPVEPAPLIDLSDFTPVRALRNLTILLNRVDSITLTRYGLKPTRFDVDVSIRWMESDVGR